VEELCVVGVGVVLGEEDEIDEDDVEESDVEEFDVEEADAEEDEEEDDESEEDVLDSVGKGTKGTPRQEARASSLASCACSIRSWKQSTWASHPSGSAGCVNVIPLGTAVLAVVVVESVPEHVAVVEQSVVKALVDDPLTIFVTLQFETVVLEQLMVVDVVCVVPVREHASTVAHEVTKRVELPEMTAVASHVGTAVFVHSSEDEVDVGLSEVAGSVGSLGFVDGGV
jgi:hypothetical protein